MNRDQLDVGVSPMHIMEKQDGFVDANRDLNDISIVAVTTGSSELCKGGNELPPCFREKSNKNQMKMPNSLLCWKGSH